MYAHMHHPPSGVRPTLAYAHVGVSCTSVPATALHTSLHLQRSSGLWSNATQPGFVDLAGVFASARSSAVLDGARKGEVQSACNRFLQAAHDVLTNITKFHEQFTWDSHSLPPVLAAVAECQKVR